MAKKRRKNRKQGSGRSAAEPAADTPRFGAGKGLLFGSLIYVAFFALVEGVLWAAGVETLLDREDPFRGFSGLVAVYERDGDVYRTTPANTKHTFNDQSFLADKPENGLRIFGLGGSSAFGFPWGAEAAFTGIVGEAIAARHPELHVEAVNAAGTSYAMHRLNLVADELLRYAPDVFIVYSGHNEFVEPAFFEAVKRRGSVRTRIEFLLAHSRLYSVLRRIADAWSRAEERAPADFGVDVLRDESRIYTPEEKRAIADEYRFRLQRMVRRAHEAGVRTVLVTVPANLRDWRPNASTSDPTLSADQKEQWSQALVAGRHALEAGGNEAALTALERAAGIDPGHAETWYLLGQARERLGRFEEARVAYERACDLDASPIRRTDAINEAIRSVAREEGSLLVDADRIFRERAEHGLVGLDLIEDYVHPTIEGHEIIAWTVWDALERSGWLGEGSGADREVFERILAERRLHPTQKNAVWFYNQGVLLANQGRANEAIEKYREALEIQPSYESALVNLGHLLTETGRDAEAVAVLQRLLAIDHQRTGPGAHVNLGNALKNLGRLEEAASHYRAALALDPDMAFVYTNLADALRDLGRYDEALDRYREAHRRWPEDAVNQNAWGVALTRMKRYDEAVERYRDAVRLKPDYAEAHRNWGATLATEGRYAEALGHYETAVRLDPTDTLARRQLELVRSRLGPGPGGA
jgi:tetratricopeptide (TPR) repeat protein